PPSKPRNAHPSSGPMENRVCPAFDTTSAYAPYQSASPLSLATLSSAPAVNFRGSPSAQLAPRAAPASNYQPSMSKPEALAVALHAKHAAAVTSPARVVRTRDQLRTRTPLRLAQRL